MPTSRFSLLNNFSQGEVGRHLLSSGPSSRYYKHSAVKAENVLLSRNGGCAKRPALQDITESRSQLTRGPNRVTYWEVSQTERYEVHWFSTTGEVFDDYSTRSIMSFRLIPIDADGEPYGETSRERVRDNRDPNSVTPGFTRKILAYSSSLTAPSNFEDSINFAFGDVNDLSLAHHTTGIYIAEPGLYPIIIERTVVRDITSVTIPGAGNLDFRFVRPIKFDGDGADANPTEWAVFTVKPFVAASFGLVDLGVDPISSLTFGDDKDPRTTGDFADGTRLTDVSDSYGGDEYTIRANYLVEDGDVTQGKSIYVTPEGVYYKGQTGAPTRLADEKQLIPRGVVLANHNYATVFNPEMGYPSTVVIKDRRLQFMGHRSARYGATIWRSQIDNFREFGDHFRSFTVDNPTTDELKENLDQYDVNAASKLPTFGVQLDLGIPGTIRGAISGGTNLLVYTSDILYQIREEVLGASINTIIEFLDNVSIRPNRSAIVDQAVYIFDDKQDTAVREKVNYLSLSDTAYQPERISTLKNYERLNDVSHMTAVQIKKFAADLVLFVNGDGTIGVFHTATEGGESVYAAWANWSSDFGKFKSIYSHSGRLFATIEDGDTSDNATPNIHRCEFIFDEMFQDEFFVWDDVGVRQDDIFKPVVSEIVLPEALYESVDGYFGRFSKGLEEVHIDIIDATPFDLEILPNIPSPVTFRVQVGEVLKTFEESFTELQGNTERWTGAWFTACPRISIPRARPYYADMIRMTHSGNGPFEIGVIEMVGYAEPQDIRITGRNQRDNANALRRG